MSLASSCILLGSVTASGFIEFTPVFGSLKTFPGPLDALQTPQKNRISSSSSFQFEAVLREVETEESTAFKTRLTGEKREQGTNRVITETEKENNLVNDLQKE